MWRLAQHLVGKCIYVDQDISFIGVIAAKVTAIYVEGHKVGLGSLSCRLLSVTLKCMLIY